ncbi:hypothetical protein [Alkalicoccus saliphilus]|uniref:Uncharacterized protein n=1 Tax=Alkalicoccus saliphilus TaxID=200989 RepID=A0A2T4U327_9BACI|nr:hypothetical protein [Alkalicoccus saliphilus]PTL37801.1 hypothetical protein C6Y45_14665 [Alkalicoccus saliphilus]
MLGRPHLCMDDVCFDYYEEIGFSEFRQEETRRKRGFNGVYHYWKPFEAYAVKRIMEDFPHHIHDFGAGHAGYEEEKEAIIVKKH